MPNADRWAMSAGRGFTAAGLVIGGLFVLCCGIGMTSPAMFGIGVAVAALGPTTLLLSGMRRNVREYVYGEAYVSSVSPRPPASVGPTGRGEFEIVVYARDIDGVSVRVRDADVPMPKWPEAGARLPVVIPNGNPRKTQVLWNEVPEVPNDYYADEYDTGVPVEFINLDDMPATEPDEPTGPNVASEPAAEQAAGEPVVVAAEALPRRRPSPRPRPPLDDTDTVVVARAPVPGHSAGPPLIPSARTDPESNDAGGTILEMTVRGVAEGTDILDLLAAEAAAEEARANDLPVDAGVHGVSVTLIVSNLSQSLAFYRDLVGLTVLDSAGSSAVLRSGDARILLKQVADMPPVDRRVVHLNLEVDDLDREYARLKDHGVELVHRPRMVSQGVQLEQWAATFRDPDGHAISLTRWVTRP